VTNIRAGMLGGWGDLRIDGYIGGKIVISKTMSGQGVDRLFNIEPDDTELIGDGIDATRVVIRVTDEFGASRAFATGAISLAIDGPGEIIGENPFSLFGGVGAEWVRTKESAGMIRLTARHPSLGAKTVQIRVALGVHSP
jgi:beta-galactosidase